jgi:antitoxin CcdA
MLDVYDHSAPKKSANLSVNSDLLTKARAVKINLSATLEEALEQKLAKAEADKWLKENKNAIKTYNNFVEKNGCFGDEYRDF